MDYNQESSSEKDQILVGNSFLKTDNDISSWYLFDRYGHINILNKKILFIGREDADLQLKSQSVDCEHALLCYDPVRDQYKIKDLSSLNGTFVNETRIPEDTYVYIESNDSLRFGYDSSVFRLRRSQSSDIIDITDVKSQQNITASNSPQRNSPKLTAPEVVHCDSPRNSRRHPRTISPDSLLASQSIGNRFLLETSPMDSIEELSMPLIGSVPTPLIRAPTTATLATKKSVQELYGQPAWWGEDDVEDVHRAIVNTATSPTTADVTGQHQVNGEPHLMSSTCLSSTSAFEPRLRPAEAFVISLDDPPLMDDVLDGMATAKLDPMLYDSFEADEIAENGTMSNCAAQPLSQFMPPNIRKSFNERKEMQARKLAANRQRSSDNRCVVADKKAPNSNNVANSATTSSIKLRHTAETVVTRHVTRQNGSNTTNSIERSAPKRSNSSATNTRRNSTIGTPACDIKATPIRKSADIGASSTRGRSTLQGNRFLNGLNIQLPVGGKSNLISNGSTRANIAVPASQPRSNPRSAAVTRSATTVASSARASKSSFSATSKSRPSEVKGASEKRNPDSRALLVEETLSSYSNAKSYLFERMFAGNVAGGGGGEDRTESFQREMLGHEEMSEMEFLDRTFLKAEDSLLPSEYKLYPEAQAFDKPCHEPSDFGRAPSEAGTYTIGDEDDEACNEAAEDDVLSQQKQQEANDDLFDEVISNLRCYNEEFELKSTGGSSSVDTVGKHADVEPLAAHTFASSPSLSSNSRRQLAAQESALLLESAQPQASELNTINANAANHKSQLSTESAQLSSGSFRRKGSDSMLSDILSTQCAALSDVMSSPRMARSYHSGYHGHAFEQQQRQWPSSGATTSSLDTTLLLQDTESLMKELKPRCVDATAGKHQLQDPSEEIGLESEADLSSGEMEVLSHRSRGSAADNAAKVGYNVLHNSANRNSTSAALHLRKADKGSNSSSNTSAGNESRAAPMQDGRAGPGVRGNKTYAMRRALNVSKDAHHRGSASGAVGKTSDKMSVHSELSLGAKIVMRSRAAPTLSSEQSQMQRADYGRHSLKLSAASASSPAPPPPTTASSRQHTSEATSLSTAWQRHKDYDPRKSVAEAKARAAAASGATLCNMDSDMVRDSRPPANLTSDVHIAKMSSELRKDLQILAQSEDLAPRTCRKSAFSPVCSPDSPGLFALRHAKDNGNVGPTTAYRSKSAAALPCEDSPQNEAYDSLMVSSILQISRKLRRCSDEILQRLRRTRQLSRTPSPVEDILSQSSSVVVTDLHSSSLQRSGTLVCGSTGASTTARCYSQHAADLQDSLRNLKAVEYQLQCTERALFPQTKSGRSSAMGSCSENDYLVQLERINQELRGFAPIHTAGFAPPSEHFHSLS